MLGFSTPDAGQGQQENEIKKGGYEQIVTAFYILVELSGIEPLTS